MRFIQISDMHIFSSQSQRLNGVVTYEKFENIVFHILSNHCHGVDGILITGDLSQDGSVESYDSVFSLISRLSLPIYWIHGNHDTLDRALPQGEKYNAKYLDFIDDDFWNIVAIDSTFGNNDYGVVSNDEMAKLHKLIKTKKQTVLVMHHHPVPVGTPLVDVCGVKNGAEFMSFVESVTSIKLILCGHVHGEYTPKAKSIDIETCPATCFQWVKGTDSIKIEVVSGYKILDFSKNCYRTQCIYLS